MAGPDLPKVQIADAIVLDFQPGANERLETAIRYGIEQNRATVPDQAERPACNHAGANQAHDRIDPGPIEAPRQSKTDDGGDRCRRVGNNVHVRRTQIAVAMMMAVIMGLMPAMMVIIPQQKGTHDIHDEPQRRDGDSFAI